jgi:hypothetical protein
MMISPFVDISLSDRIDSEKSYRKLVFNDIMKIINKLKETDPDERDDGPS